MEDMGESILQLEEAIITSDEAMESPELLFGKIIVLMGLAVFLIYIVIKLKLPTIMGYLATGILAGSHGMSLVDNPHRVESLSELGVVLLLFTIGLEFPMQNLLKIRRVCLMGGGLQTLFCTLITFPIALYLGFSPATSLLLCFLVSLSSTAVVLKLLQERGEMDSLHGQGTLAVLIFQDFAVVPMMLLLPFIAGTQGDVPFHLAAGKTALLLVGLVFVVIVMVPRILQLIAMTQCNELFLFTVVLICIGTSFLTAEAGLSLALGAFVSGLVIASSPYSLHAISMITPMRDIFTSLFFVSIGMRMDLNYLIENPLLTLAIVLAVMAISGVGTYAAMRLTGLNRRVGILIAFSLCQSGEFSFVLASSAGNLHLLGNAEIAMFLNAAVITMVLTPPAMALGRFTANKLAMRKNADDDGRQALNGHVVIVGFGVAGKGAARACRVAGRPYRIIDLNPVSVEELRQQGESIVFGDAAHAMILEHAGLNRADVLVVTIPDPEATIRIVRQARKVNSDIYIMARTRFERGRDSLIQLGADKVMVEEQGIAVDIFNAMMAHLDIDPEERTSRLAEAKTTSSGRFHVGNLRGTRVMPKVPQPEDENEAG